MPSDLFVTEHRETKHFPDLHDDIVVFAKKIALEAPKAAAANKQRDLLKISVEAETLLERYSPPDSPPTEAKKEIAKAREDAEAAILKFNVLEEALASINDSLKKELPLAAVVARQKLVVRYPDLSAWAMAAMRVGRKGRRKLLVTWAQLDKELVGDKSVVDLDVCGFRDLAPLLDFRCDVRPERFGATRRHFGAVGDEFFLDFALRQHFQQRIVQLCDDLFRRSGRDKDALPAGRVVTLQAGFFERWHIRHRRQSRRTGDADCAQLARLDVWLGDGQHVDQQLHLSAQQIGDGRRAALYGTCSMSMPTCVFSISPARCVIAPLPPDA